jgi:hypothetical protein
VAFAGDETYGAASASATLSVVQPVPVLTYTGATNAKAGVPITLSAWLHVGFLMPLAGRTVTFTLKGTNLSATTNGLGIASVKTTAPAPTAVTTYPITATFAGDTAYVSASAAASLQVIPRSPRLAAWSVTLGSRSRVPGLPPTDIRTR